MPRPLAPRRIQRQHVAHREEALVIVVERGAPLEIRRQPRLVSVMHGHAERRAHPRQLAPDPPHAEDAQPPPRDLRAHQLRRRPAIPAPAAHQPLPLAGPPRRRQDQHHRAFRRRHAQHVRRVDHRDAPRPGRRDVDMVEPDAERPDDLHAVRQLADRVRIHLLGRAAQDRRRRPRPSPGCPPPSPSRRRRSAAPRNRARPALRPPWAAAASRPGSVSSSFSFLP